MATLNLSTNGPSISKSYQSIVSSPAPSGAAANSPTYGQWAVFSVSTPLVNAFQQDAGGKESVLKVQSTGEGELVDLIDEFSDGRVQFAFAKVKDPNTGLQKYVLIGWCGEGVPERTKGYFTSHLAAVSKVLQGYHVQITARSDRDLTPEGIVQKVSDASGSRYSSGAPTASSGPPPPALSKPAFTPTRSSGGGTGYNPLGATRQRAAQSRDGNLDEDGWGQDAPPVTRTHLEKVPSSYQPTKVNFKELTSQKPEPSRFNGTRESDRNEQSDVIKGGYQPVGKVDIAALRRQAQESGSKSADRPETVKGSYEPVGKVDIAAIRARAQPPSKGAPPSTTQTSAAESSDRDGEPKSLSDRSAAFSTSERMTSLPKPKVANRLGSSTATFTGTKAPSPGGFGRDSKPAPAPVGTASRTFADQGGKTPAQQWAEKKARERGLSGGGDKPSPTGFGGPTSPIASQTSGGGEWKSGYAGKSWAPVATTQTGRSASSSSIAQQRTGHDEEPQQQEAPMSPAAGISAIRDRFKDAPPMGASATGASRSAPSPPPLDASNKPNAGRGVPIPGLPTRPAQPTHDEDEDEEEEEEHQATRLPTPPPQPPRSPTPPTPPAMRSSSPIRVAMPVSRNPVPEIESAREEQFSPPPPMPMKSFADAVPHEDELTDEPQGGHDPARAAAEATAAASFGQHAVETANPGAGVSGKRALVQYDYEKAEDNEIELREGEYVTNIEMVDEDWWAGQNAQGEMGLFPSNYVELVEEGGHGEGHGHEDEDQYQQGGHEHAAPAAAAGAAHEEAGGSHGPTATALYDYEAAEDNEVSFPEGAKITGVSFPDEDWWMGEYEGNSGLFPANYVQLDE